MFGEKNLHNGLASDGESSQSKLSRLISKRIRENPDEKIGFSDKGIDFLKESEMGSEGFRSKPPKLGNSGSQELTLSYLCEHSKLSFHEKEISGKILPNSFEKKGKEAIISDNSKHNDKWVERDFLNLSDNRGNPSKREVDEQIGKKENRDTKAKLETLNLSLALPDVSVSLTASNALQEEDPLLWSKPSRSIQSLAPSNNNTQTTCSNDFTAASLSHSYSHPFSHNPSCSLTLNSTDNYECSVGRDDQIWNCGEGTNGSVHSRFRPIGDGVSLSNHGGGLYSLRQSNRAVNKDLCNGHHRTTSSDNHSFFPSELPARPKLEMQSGDLRGKTGSENLRRMEGTDVGREQKISRPERILREIIWESIPVMAQIVQELSDETLVSIKDYLKNLISMPENRDELMALQTRLERRSDLTKEALLKCHKDQLEILVAVKIGPGSFISGKHRCSITELVDIFLLLRCRNCKTMVPVDDCECRICSTNKGFCSSCMCPICLNFVCANNTCSWVGCDVCSHWCHAACGIQRNLIRPGPSLKGPSGIKEMQFNCIACSHASEMFGFVKDVFTCCANEWNPKTLMKELECVKSIFWRSEDHKGKELYIKTDELLSQLDRKMISPRDACNFIIQFFNYSMPEFPTSSVASTELVARKTNVRKDGSLSLTQADSLTLTYSIQNMSSSSIHQNLASPDLRQNDHKASTIRELKIEDEFRFRTSSKEKGLYNLESIIRVKEAEARMFQNKADDARREAEGLQRIIIAKTEKLEEEYTEKLAKLGLHETEGRQRKKLEELKVLENSHFDYYNMKMRMQTEIAGLLDRMEATKKQ